MEVLKCGARVRAKCGVGNFSKGDEATVTSIDHGEFCTYFSVDGDQFAPAMLRHFEDADTGAVLTFPSQ